MKTPSTAPAQVRAHQVAQLVAELCAPAVLVALVTTGFALATSPTLLSGIAWTLASAGLCAGVPFAVMAHGARTGQWDTHHVRDRADRLRPLVISIGSVVLGLTLIVAGGAPRPLVALVAGLLGCLVAETVITRWWKISLHAGIAAGALASLVSAYGPGWWWATVAVIAVGWSRVSTGDHTVAQVIAGASLGFAVTGGLYLAVLP